MLEIMVVIRNKIYIKKSNEKHSLKKKLKIRLIKKIRNYYQFISLIYIYIYFKDI